VYRRREGTGRPRQQTASVPAELQRRRAEVFDTNRSVHPCTIRASTAGEVRQPGRGQRLQRLARSGRHQSERRQFHFPAIIYAPARPPSPCSLFSTQGAASIKFNAVEPASPPPTSLHLRGWTAVEKAQKSSCGLANRKDPLWHLPGGRDNCLVVPHCRAREGQSATRCTSLSVLIRRRAAQRRLDTQSVISGHERTSIPPKHTGRVSTWCRVLGGLFGIRPDQHDDRSMVT